MKIVTAKFTDERKTDVFDVCQWDYGQVLRIEGLKLPKMVEIHFSLQDTAGEAVTRIGTTKDGVTDVIIPDSMLENEGATGTYKIHVWVYLTDADSGSTEYKVTIHVKARSKPEIPGGGDNPDAFHEAVLEVRKSAEKAEEAQRQAEGYAHGREDLPERAEDNAKHYSDKASEDAKKTAEDRKEVERLVESVSGIDEQVAKVEKLSKDAQEAATQAGTSAEQAEEYKQAAETASSAAQTAAQETEADRTSVEKAKTEVESLSAQVQKNKESVDETTQDFTLTAQQTLADVNNAGQTQTERVQTAGTTAVENVKTAQDTATQAIEAAKTEAVKAVQTEGTTQTGNVTTEGEKQVQAVQQAAQEIIADREQITKNKTEIADLRQNKADAIVESASGTLLNVKDSANALFKDFSVYGKSEQVQMTGANLFNDRQLLDENNPNYDKTLASIGIWWFKIPVSETVTISIKNKKTKSDCYLATSEKRGLDSGGNVAWLTHPTAPLKNSVTINPNDGNIWLGVNTNFKKIKEMLEKVGGIMLNAGSEPKPYEPYTGGKPSPSPEYPQEILNAGRLNEDTGKYEVDVKVTGKNLIPFPYPDIKEIGKTIHHNGVDYTVLQDGGVRLKGTPQDMFGLNICTIPFKEYGTVKASNLIYYDPNNDKTFFLLNEYIGKAIDMVVYPQVECGTVSTDYEPYRQPQTITLQLDRPLTKRDRLEKREGIWGIVRKSEIKILDGTENWYHYLAFKNSTLRCYCVDSIKSENGFRKSLCSHFKNVANAWFNEIGKYGYYSDHNNLQNKYFISDKQTVDDFKAWLAQQKEAGTPVELVYKTAEETWEPLPKEIQSALNALHTNYPTTVVSNSEDTEMQLTYVADTKNYTDRKIEQAVSAQVQNLANLLSLMPLSTQAAMIEADTNNILDNMEVQK